MLPLGIARSVNQASIGWPIQLPELAFGWIAVGGNQVNGYHPVQRLAIFVKCPHVTDVSGLLILNREQATS